MPKVKKSVGKMVQKLSGKYLSLIYLEASFYIEI